MTKEEALTVSTGDIIIFKKSHKTPNRNFEFPMFGDQKVKVEKIHTEESGYVHFDVGIKLPDGEPALLSLDTGEEIDGSDTYWMHPSRFELIVN